MRILKVVFLTICSFTLVYILTVKLLKSPANANSPVSLSESDAASSQIVWKEVPEEDEIRAELRRFFEDLKNKYGFNGNILIGHRSQLLYEASIGKSGLANEHFLDSNSVFQIASLSKQFTALAILQLAQSGKIDLDKPFKHYFPSFPYPEVTVEMLLTHRSGLPNYMYFCDRVCDQRKPICNNDVLDLICKHRPAPYLPPGKRFDYSNTGYALLASLVSKQSGLSFPEYTRQFLFNPLGMLSTLVYDKCTSSSQLTNKTIGFDTNGRPAEDTYLDGVTGDKGIYTTARDLFRWSVGLSNFDVVKQSWIEKAWTSRNPELRPEENYGYGFRIRNLEKGKRVVYHAGWWHGYHALFMKLLHNDITIIILSNRANWSIKQIDQLQEILNKHYSSSL